MRGGPEASGPRKSPTDPKEETVALPASADRSSDRFFRWVLLGADGDLGDVDEHVGFHGVGLDGFVQEGGGRVGDHYARGLRVEPSSVKVTTRRRIRILTATSLALRASPTQVEVLSGPASKGNVTRGIRGARCLEVRGSQGCRSGIEPGVWGYVAGEPEQQFFGDLVQFLVPVV